MKAVHLTFLSMGVLTGACRALDPLGSEVQTVSVAGGDAAHLAVEVRENGDQLETDFYYDSAAGRRRYEPMHAAPIVALASGAGYRLTYLGVEIGHVRAGIPYLCDQYDLDGQRVSYACNANFFNPGSLPSAPPAGAVAQEIYVFDVSLAEPVRDGLALTDTTVTLEAFAQNQINQYGTSTCAYNAATGIMEILQAMRTGTLTDFSEPFYLARAPAFQGETSWFWTMYQRIPSEAGGMLANADLPVTEIYRSGVGFSTAQSRAEDRYKRTGGSLIPVAAETRAEKIFFKAEWSGGYMRGNGQATADDLRATADWFLRNMKPVNVQYWIGGVWHSVIMIGYDSASDSVLIKDSLGNTHLKGSWKSKQWFLRYVYAAIGVTDGGALPPPDTGTLPPDGGGTGGGGGVVPPPTDVDDGTTLDALRSRLKVELVNGGRSGRYHVFTLKIAGAAADLDRIVDVRYDIHPSFGASATRTVADRASRFELGRYLTYANGWLTRGTVIRVRVGSQIEEITLPGTRISW